MARASFSGTLRIGLVAFPVKAFTVVAEERDLQFHHVHAKCGSKLKELKFCTVCGVTPETDELTRGVDLAGQWFFFTEEELKALKPENSEIEILQLTSPRNLRSVWHQKSYFLMPSDAPSNRPFALISMGLQKLDQVAVARFAARGKDHLAIIEAIPGDGGLAMHIICYASSVRDLVKDYEWKAPEVQFTPQEVKLTNQLLTAMRGPFEHTAFIDSFEAKARAAIEAKKANQPIPVLAAAPKETLVDVMEALTRSVEAAERRSRVRVPAVGHRYMNPEPKKPAKGKKRSRR